MFNKNIVDWLFLILYLKQNQKYKKRSNKTGKLFFLIINDTLKNQIY